MPSNPDPSNSGKFSRRVDPPTPSLWSGRPAEDAPAPPNLAGPHPPHDDTPTLSGDAIGSVAEPELDPRELARRLAKTAKEKAQARRAPPLEEPMRADDPRELARRLADEARRRLNPSSASPSVDPLPAPAPAPPAPPAAPAPSGRRRPVSADALPIFEDVVSKPEAPKPEAPKPEAPKPVVARAAPVPVAAAAALDEVPFPPPADDEPPSADPDPDPPPDLPKSFARGRSLAERAAPAKPRKGMSAAEALAAARLAEAEARSPAPERSATARRAPAPPPPAPAPPAPPAPAPTATAPAAAPAPAAARPAPRAPAANPAGTFAELFPGASVEAPILVTQLEVFRALWRAHRARAMHDQQLELVGTSSVLLDAAERGVRIAAARVTVGGQAWAAWIDVDRGVLLGAARPAEIYLAGL